MKTTFYILFALSCLDIPAYLLLSAIFFKRIKTRLAFGMSFLFCALAVRSLIRTITIYSIGIEATYGLLRYGGLRLGIDALITLLLWGFVFDVLGILRKNGNGHDSTTP